MKKGSPHCAYKVAETEQLMAEIRDLGHLPGRRSKQRKLQRTTSSAEDTMAQRLARARNNKELSVEQEAELERIAGADESEQLMAEIRDLGHLPRRRKKPVGGEVAENNLAQRLARARKNKQLSVEQEAELERIAGFGSEQVPRTLPRSTLDRPQSDPRSTPDGDAMHHYAL